MTPLHHIGNFLRELVLLIPLWAARGIFVAVLLVVFIWVLRLPKERTRSPGGNQAGLSGNLKFWAAVAIGIQILIYLIL
ncbi:MAG: hypothetical protein KJT03_00315 [Verrucomicrobiae bacterium]|nr:hypothetical protein [Verrucomicrobiae bacterium]